MISNKPQITNIIKNKEDPAKRDLFVDGEFFLSIPASILMAQDLHLGDPFGEEEQEALLLAIKLIPAMEKAYQYLSYGDLAHKRLYEKLVKFGIEPEVAESACQKMEQKGYIDDAKLAKKLARKFAETKRWGARRILPEIIQRGIPADLAREVTDGLEVDFEQSARSHLQKKYRRSDLTDPKEKQRVSQGLLRLGFSYDTVRNVLEDFE